MGLNQGQQSHEQHQGWAPEDSFPALCLPGECCCSCWRGAHGVQPSWLRLQDGVGGFCGTSKGRGNSCGAGATPEEAETH